MFTNEQTNFNPPLASTPLKRKEAGREQTQPTRLSPINTGAAVDRSNLEASFVSTNGGQRNLTRCDICHHEGYYANHLRQSPDCLHHYRRQPDFNIEGTDEEFIVKSTLMIRDCPVPYCPDGSHRNLPGPCLDWWREVGKYHSLSEIKEEGQATEMLQRGHVEVYQEEGQNNYMKKVRLYRSRIYSVSFAILQNHWEFIFIPL